MSIRFLILFFLFGLTNIQLTNGQTKQDKVNYIKQVFASINRDTSLKKLTLDSEQFLDYTPDGGGSLTAHFKNKNILKITEEIGLSYGTIEIEYYFDKSQLIFAYAREKQFKLTDEGIDQSKLTLKFEGRYYFSNNKLIDTKRTGSGIWDGGQDKSAELKEEATRFLKLILSRIK